jgi:adenylyltransferase/sulfurtransferase
LSDKQIKVVQKRTHYRQTQQRDSATNRQERILGWRQDRLEQGRALILGAGALGNEVAKNLALMGLGYMMIADFDRIERSNLSRAVFFRKTDARYHRPKAEVVAKRAQAINVTADAHAQAFHGDVVWELGGGVFRRVDVVLGCLDNVEARSAANATCLLTGTPYIDGGILGLAGNVTVVEPPTTACWECTTSAAERRHARDRYDSCSQVMRRGLKAGRLPSVQIASSIVAGYQAQEAVKVIQGLLRTAGFMIQYDASGTRPDLDVVTISRRPDCWCNRAETISDVIELSLSSATHTMQDVVSALERLGFQHPQVALPGPFVAARHCYGCHRTEPIMHPAFRLNTSVLACRFCEAQGDQVELLYIEQLPSEAFDRIEGGRALGRRVMELPMYDLGFPALALVHFSTRTAEGGCAQVAELSADAPQVMGKKAFADVRSRFVAQASRRATIE